MTVALGVVRAGERSAREIAAQSRSALDRPLVHAGELWVAVARDEALLVGAFQRGVGMPPALPLVRRGSGGPEVLIGPGTVHVALALAHPAALEFCDEKRIVNRMVRPLLRALTKTGSLAHFFGRDWISVAHRPVAWVGFAHDASSRRTLFEAFVAVRSPFAVTERASFLGKPHGTLESIAGCEIDPARVAGAIVDAYLAAYDATEAEVRGDETAPVPDGAIPAGSATEDDPRADLPWTATVEEAIGRLGAGCDARGIFRVGGDLLVSRDAIARLESRVANVADEDLGPLVDQILTTPGVALQGIRSLASVRDVIAHARAPTRALP